VWDSGSWYSNDVRFAPRLAIVVWQRTWKWTKSKNAPPNGFPCRVPNFDEMIWNPPVEKHGKNIVGMGVHRIVEQMGKVDPKNLKKTIAPKKWLIMTLNWRCFGQFCITFSWVFILNLGFRMLGTLMRSKSFVELFVVEVFHKDFGTIFNFLMFTDL